ncbi:MAG: VWA domain-containing protein [Flavobacteriaceae bacterium]|nr:VWA domain-containing protein [Candidatus Arcticimaribacter sp.]MDA9360662.1 VWA domain-containing protein [Flavobacteriaceae bacterium]MDB4066525.1 VWA domain-containing protein [Flavobacteriaceae bacterium]MDB4153097.1 VWA domain-containing protein [Flavobacteriaceae bacterium]MDB9988283.1 VWA domain-containing protein [Flavobacteriaceae bacterium]
MFEGIELANPEYLWGLIALPLVILWYVYKRKFQQARLTISSTKGFEGVRSNLARFQPLLFVFRICALALVVLALARPQTVDISSRTKTNKGIDIVMAIDVSSSMLAQDLKPSRLNALKEVAADFIDDRQNDRIGLVVYAGESYTKTPITSDKRIVKNALRSIRYDGVINDGTAIGMGLATAVNRLKDSRAKSKVIILLTDGVNNSGFIEPKIAAELAVEFQIKTYTIGLGSNGTAKAPIGVLPNGKFQYGLTKVEIDEELLKAIADDTGGLYFRATDTKKLKDIYNEINKLEKTEVEEFKYYNYQEKYRILILIALGLLFAEWILKNTIFRSFI